LKPPTTNPKHIKTEITELLTEKMNTVLDCKMMKPVMKARGNVVLISSIWKIIEYRLQLPGSCSREYSDSGLVQSAGRPIHEPEIGLMVLSSSQARIPSTVNQVLGPEFSVAAVIITAGPVSSGIWLFLGRQDI
jgi:hypothetical protein